MRLRGNRKRHAGGRSAAKANGGTVVGVHLSQGGIRLARSRHGHIQAYERVEFASDMSLESQEFEALLGTTLRRFCADAHHAKIWATAPLNGHSVRNLRVPKVSQRQLLLAVRWSLERELSTSLEHTAVDFVVEGEVVEDGVNKIAVTACAVHQDEIARLSGLFERIGFPLTGLTLPCFTCKYLMQACGLANQNQSALVLNVSQTSSQILLFSRGRVIVNREFRLGAYAFLDACMDAFPEGISAERFFARFSQDLDDAPSLSPSARAEVVEAFLPVLGRLLRQFDFTLKTSQVILHELDLSEIYLAGPLCVCPEIRDLISSHVDLPVVPVNPLAAPCLAPVNVKPAPLWMGSWFISAVGLALADNTLTLNLLNPMYAIIEREERFDLDQRVLIAFISLVLVLAVARGVLGVRASQLEREFVTLEQRTPAEASMHNRQTIQPMVDALAAEYRERAGVVEARRVIAMINELATLSDDSVQLVDVDFRMGSVEKRAGVSGTATREGVEEIRIKARVFGERTMMASMLAAYQLRLEESALFGQARIDGSTIKMHLGVPVLEFTVAVSPFAPPKDDEGGA